MNEAIKYLETGDKLTIVISPLMKGIVKFGLVFQGILGICFFGVFAVIILSDDVGFMALVFGTFVVFGLYLSIKYLDRAFHRERIEITRDSFTIIDKYLFKKEVKTFSNAEILNIDFAGRNSFTEHPLAGKTGDCLGFGTSEKEMQFVVEDGP